MIQRAEESIALRCSILVNRMEEVANAISIYYYGHIYHSQIYNGIAPQYTTISLVTLLNTGDLGATTTTRVSTIGLAASSAALSAFRNHAMQQDAYRHFRWNFNMAVGIGNNVAQTAGNNQEWAEMILRRFGNVTITRALEIRRDIRTMNLAGFNGFFNNANMMDFWNNRAGVNWRTDTAF